MACKTLRRKKSDPRIGVITTPQGRRFIVAADCEHLLNLKGVCRHYAKGNCSIWRENEDGS